MALDRLDSIDLSSNSFSERIDLEGVNVLSIHPIVKNLLGSPTYTIEVSNDDGNSDVIPTLEDQENYFVMSPSLSNLNIQSTINIDLTLIAWRYMRIKINSSINDSGIVEFNINTK